eukprot:PhF_6_TR6246/c1_g1_i1/m.9446/K14965/DPY30; protein dpy-30
MHGDNSILLTTENSSENRPNTNGSNTGRAPSPSPAGGGGQPPILNEVDALNLPFDARGYLDEKVLPVLLLALTALVRERPENPVDYVAHFLLRHSKAAGRTCVEVGVEGPVGTANMVPPSKPM